ncbi:MAG TPA: UPF0149 family protein [Rhodanobacteraceae bacterium]|jgi:uncharacterized protein YgfB (UPF0149 family)|nr:UPF0149 family protein [Rhodanobacteraceae bacterium]
MPLTHAELAHALKTLRLGMGASDLHGSLTGYLCAGGSAGADEWPAALEIEPDPIGSAPINPDSTKPASGTKLQHETLRRLYRDCRAQLDDPDLGFEPLLPALDRPLETRADALVEWCRGFLGGVGLSGSAARLLSVDANEVLADIGRIAASRFDYDDAEEDESALMEVLEFVRVGVMLLHTEMMRPRSRAGGRLH